MMTSADDTSSLTSQLWLLLVLNIVSIVMQSVTAVVTAMRCKGTCPCGCSWGIRPSASLPTPTDAHQIEATQDLESPLAGGIRKGASPPP